MRTVDPVRHAARRTAIQEAAATVFAEKGYTGATTAEICRAAGVGSGTLFHYFGDKRSIMVSLFADDMALNAEVIDSLDEAAALSGDLAPARPSSVATPGTRARPGWWWRCCGSRPTTTTSTELLARSDERVRGAFALAARAVRRRPARSTPVWTRHRDGPLVRRPRRTPST